MSINYLMTIHCDLEFPLYFSFIPCVLLHGAILRSMPRCDLFNTNISVPPSPSLSSILLWFIFDITIEPKKVSFRYNVTYDIFADDFTQPAEEYVIDVYQKLMWSTQLSIASKEFLLLSLAKLSTRFTTQPSQEWVCHLVSYQHAYYEVRLRLSFSCLD